MTSRPTRRISVSKTGLHRRALHCRRNSPASHSILSDLSLARCSRTIILYRDGLRPRRTSTRALIALLRLQSVYSHRRRSYRVIARVLSTQGRTLTRITHPSSFIVDRRLVDLVLTRITRRGDVGTILASLFDPRKSRVCLGPTHGCIALRHPIGFCAIIRTTQRQKRSTVNCHHGTSTGGITHTCKAILGPTGSTVVRFRPRSVLVLLTRS